MDAFTFNKIAGAVLAALLVIFGTRTLVHEVMSPDAPEQTAYKVPGLEQAGQEAEVAADEPEEQPLAVLLASADAGDGAKGFNKCKACHSIEAGGPNKIGPALHNIVGRDIATVDGFSYSGVLAEMDGNWDYEALSAFLKDPKGFAPGTKMSFAGIKDAADRADMIAYLRENTENPPALPEVEAAEAGAAEPETDVATADSAAVGDVEAEAEVQGEADAGAEEATTASSLDAMIAAADAADGEKVFRKCKACHTIDQGGANRVGPNLYNVVGSEKATGEGFAYSTAVKELGGTWDHESLSAFLSDPRGYAKGTKMAFAGIKDKEDLAAVIAFLRSKSENPPPFRNADAASAGQ